MQFHHLEWNRLENAPNKGEVSFCKACFSLCVCVQMCVHSIVCLSKYFERYFPNWSPWVCLVPASTPLYTLTARVGDTEQILSLSSWQIYPQGKVSNLRLWRFWIACFSWSPSRSQNSTSSCPLLLLVINTITLPGLCKWSKFVLPFFSFRYQFRCHLFQADFWNVLPNASTRPH